MAFNKGYELKSLKHTGKSCELSMQKREWRMMPFRRCTTMTASSSIPNVPALSERRNFQIHRLNAVRMKHHH